MIYIQLVAGFEVDHLIAAAAHLEAGSAVGRLAERMQAHIAFAADCHAEGPVGEHLYANRLPRRAADMLGFDGIHNLPNLIQIQLAGQHHHVGELAVEAHSLHVGDAELRRNMHLQPQLAASLDAGDIRGDDGVHPCLTGSNERLPHIGHIPGIESDIEGKICLHSGLVAASHHLGKIFRGEVGGRAGAHVKVAYPEIHRIRSALNGGCKALEAPGGSHYLKLFHQQQS